MDNWDLEESEGGAEESFLSVVVDESPPSHPSYLEFDDIEEDDEQTEVEAGALGVQPYMFEPLPRAGRAAAGVGEDDVHPREHWDVGQW